MVEKHEFGGPWTEIKLDAINAYSKYYMGVLKNQNFETWYIDSFAGTGRRNTKIRNDMFSDEPVGSKDVVLDGSAIKAISVRPPFDHLVFIEEKAGRYKALQEIQKSHSERDIMPVRGDANEETQRVFSIGKWVDGHREGWRQRALVFLDPYGINVDWKTLQALSQSKRADVWYLVNLKALVQQLAHDHGAMDDDKKAAITRMMGTNSWEEKFYDFRAAQTDLFSQPVPISGQRNAEKHDVSDFFQNQLKSIFNYVSRPLSLKVSNQDDFFQLFCMSNNPSGPAIGMIKKGADWVINKYSRASHHRSGY